MEGRLCNRSIDEHPQWHNCVQPYRLDNSALVAPIYGVVTPALVLTTVLTNCLVCLVLVKRPMRSPSNVLLTAIAVSDTLTGTCPLPCFVYFYTLRHSVDDYVPHGWCFLLHCLTDYLPTIFHTTSVWLTVSLAAHRYVCLRCRPETVQRWCRMCPTVTTVVTVYVLALVSQLCRFFELTYVPVYVNRRLDEPGCLVETSPIVKRHLHLYFNAYYWFRVVFIHILPCFILTAINTVLIQTMRSAQARRKLLLHQNRKSDSRRLAESNSRTLMLVTVVGVFLLVEFPLAIFFVLVIVENTFDVIIVDTDKKRTTTLFVNLLIVFSYPINFFIYCGMSAQFRSTFCQLLRCRKEQKIEASDENNMRDKVNEENIKTDDEAKERI